MDQTGPRHVGIFLFEHFIAQHAVETLFVFFPDFADVVQKRRKIGQIGIHPRQIRHRPRHFRRAEHMVVEQIPGIFRPAMGDFKIFFP